MRYTCMYMYNSLKILHYNHEICTKISKAYFLKIFRLIGLGKQCKLRSNFLFIMLTSPCNVYPLTPHLYIAKLGCTMYTFF